MAGPCWGPGPAAVGGVSGAAASVGAGGVVSSGSDVGSEVSFICIYLPHRRRFEARRQERRTTSRLPFDASGLRTPSTLYMKIGKFARAGTNRSRVRTGFRTVEIGDGRWCWSTPSDRCPGAGRSPTGVAAAARIGRQATDSPRIPGPARRAFVRPGRNVQAGDKMQSLVAIRDGLCPYWDPTGGESGHRTPGRHGTRSRSSPASLAGVESGRPPPRALFRAPRPSAGPGAQLMGALPPSAITVTPVT